jgi:hypothetical protein
LAITALGGLSTLPFTNLVGLQGLIIWLPAAYAIAIGGAREAEPDPYFAPRGTPTPVPAYPPVLTPLLPGVRAR